jgi:exodeoxyribonuclease V alpha subunit
MEELFGYIEGIVYAGDEGGFTVARLKEPRKADLTCIVGVMPSIQPGETIRCQGVWKHHPQFGRQFEVQAFELQSPSDEVGIRKYLESGMIRGIGAVYAERIVCAFGVDTLEVIDKSPGRLAEVPGLGPKRIETIQSCWQDQKAIRKVMIFLRAHGVSPAFAQKIFKAYGDQSIEKVTSNPYALAREIRGIGFKSADAIALGIGLPKHSPLRLDAGIEHVLWELTNDGHVCYPEIDLFPIAADLLECSKEQVESRVEVLIREGQLVREEDKIWVKPLFLAEIGIARELARLTHHASRLRDIDAERAIVWVQQLLKIELAEEQKYAVSHGVSGKVHIITGGPGTGKSTITKAILAITERLTPHILLAAPTGRAAKRMAEITGKKASTIHSLLEMDFKAGGFKKNREHPLDCDLIIVDEASMIDTQLMHHLLKAVPNHARLLLIGDIDQLPSVGPGNVLRDIIAAGKIAVTQLKHIFRQAAGSKIVTNAHLINQGRFPDLKRDSASDFFFIDAQEPEEIASLVLELVQTRLPKRYRLHRFEEIQVLSPMKRGIIGIEHLNLLLQQRLNPSKTPLSRMGRTFHLYDKVMQTRNNYQKEVYNGDVGKIIGIDLTEQTVKVLFDKRAIDYAFMELDELVLAYAVSIHKYQGSECPCVIIPIHTTHFKLLTRNLLYTGITRGRKLVVLVGARKALAIAVRNQDVSLRHTGLEQAVRKFL